MTLIPLNPAYEEIFTPANLDEDCSLIADAMYDEAEVIKALAEREEYQQAALRFMQLAKSMCIHFIEEEHWTLFDDCYDPELALDCLIRYFNDLLEKGALPQGTKAFLHDAWQEILQTECYQEYGIPQNNCKL